MVGFTVYMVTIIEIYSVKAARLEGRGAGLLGGVLHLLDGDGRGSRPRPSHVQRPLMCLTMTWCHTASCDTMSCT